jgi:hypothetical protein
VTELLNSRSTPPELLGHMHHRSEQAQADLSTVRARIARAILDLVGAVRAKPPQGVWRAPPVGVGRRIQRACPILGAAGESDRNQVVLSCWARISFLADSWLLRSSGSYQRR